MPLQPTQPALEELLKVDVMSKSVLTQMFYQQLDEQLGKETEPKEMQCEVDGFEVWYQRLLEYEKREGRWKNLSAQTDGVNCAESEIDVKLMDWKVENAE